MKAVVYRPVHLRGSWRPRSLVDNRGPTFPEEYRELLVLEIEDIEPLARFERIQTEIIPGLFDKHVTQTGDLVFLGDSEELNAFVTGPMGWEIVKFGAEWRSPS
jgi:hypothetical protein